jgi:hypothetical protein
MEKNLFSLFITNLSVSNVKWMFMFIDLITQFGKLELVHA